MRKPGPIDSDRLILVPFDRREAISVAKAAEKAGKSESTVRSWCVDRGIGRRVADGPWQVSRVALQMLLDDDKKALCAYHQGERTSPLVARYFDRFGLTTSTAWVTMSGAVALNCALCLGNSGEKFVGTADNPLATQDPPTTS
jgi:hypothetical protein